MFLWTVIKSSFNEIFPAKECFTDSEANFVWLLGMIEQQQKLIN